MPRGFAFMLAVLMVAYYCAASFVMFAGIEGAVYQARDALDKVAETLYTSR